MDHLPLVLPRRLEALSAHLATTAEDVFADWQLARRAPLTKLFPDGEADLVAVAGAHLVPFAGDFSGGVLALDTLATDVENAHVVAFDSEGGITVLGESFDDFLALLASEIPDAREDAWVAGEDLESWIRSVGIVPHRSASTRLLELGEITRRFWLRWTGSLRESACRLRPGENSDLELVLGERIGDVSLGMRREALDAKFGAPSVPSWGKSEHDAIAIYPGLPTVVRLDAAEETVIGVTLYKGRHRAVTADAFDPMFARLPDAEAWLASLGVAFARERSSLVVPGLRTTFSLESARGAGAGDPWIESIALTLA